MKTKIKEKMRKMMIALAVTATVNSVPCGAINASVPVFAGPATETAMTVGVPKTTTKTEKKVSKKKVVMKKAAKKSYTKKISSKTETDTKTANSPDRIIVTKTTIKTVVKEKFTKGSKVKVAITTVVTTTKTTVTPLDYASSLTYVSPDNNNKGKYEVNAATLAPLMDARVLKAFRTMGFKVYVDPSVSYAGYFDSRDRSITLREESDNLYHELGHFLAFVAGNVDQSSSFKAVYAQEKGKYIGYNKAYVTKDSAEYFAESTKDYILHGTALKSSRPQTYAAIKDALDKVTDAQITKIMKVYGPFWK